MEVNMNNKTDPWMPLWIGDYLADTQHMTRDEHGGYLLLLMAYWRAGSALPDDDKRLRAIVKASHEEWKELRQTLAEFFTISDGLWIHRRVEAELAGARERKAKAVEKAKIAAGARWKPDATSNATSNAQAMLEQCPSPSPSHISTSVDIKNKRASRFDAQAHLCSVGVPEQIARDWLAHRKAKRAAPTQTAIDGIAREAAKARIALSDALSLCCQRGWIGFEASWINGQGLSGKPPPNGRKPTAAESRIAVIAELTGRNHGLQAAQERDITAYSERIA